MIYWAIEYKTGRSWSVDHRTIRCLRRDALQAPIDIDPREVAYDRYHEKRRKGTARPVKIRIVRLP